MRAKQHAAEKAVELIQDGMVIGLGSGSTATFAVEKIGDLVRHGRVIRGIATSSDTERLARHLGIPLADADEPLTPDLALDGADEVDTNGNLLKGGGGSLLREKIVAFASKAFYVMVDQSKLVNVLGKRPLPVEVVRFGAALTLSHIRALGAEPVLRQANGDYFVTDNGNLIADCNFGEIAEPALLDMKLKMIPGVIETGLFPSKVVTGIFVGFEDKDTKLIVING